MIFLWMGSGLDARKIDRAYRRFVEKLNNVAVGVADIERNRTVAMMAQGMDYRDAVLLSPGKTALDLCDRRNNEPQVIQRLRGPVASVTKMQREIVASRGKVGVVSIRLPDHAHPENLEIKFLGALHVGDRECEVPESAIGNHLWAVPFARYRAIAKPATAQIGSDGGPGRWLRSITPIFSNAPLSAK